MPPAAVGGCGRHLVQPHANDNRTTKPRGEASSIPYTSFSDPQVVHSAMRAPVTQWIEHRSSEAETEVSFQS
ncbi:MAG: hypothetical protein ACXABY_36720 [Candidatus Thorarchaeota archaeon]|jgi:hypothetical protein